MIIVPHLSLFLQVAIISKKSLSPAPGWGALRAFLGPIVVGGFLLQRNVLHSFATWAQFRQPEKQELRYCRNGKQKILHRTAPQANPNCPWNYPADKVRMLQICVPFACRLGAMMFYNPPYIFWGAWNTLSPLLPPPTLAKIKVGDGHCRCSSPHAPSQEKQVLPQVLACRMTCAQLQGRSGTWRTNFTFHARMLLPGY
jgi:hypothetical protein